MLPGHLFILLSLVDSSAFPFPVRETDSALLLHQKFAFQGQALDVGDGGQARSQGKSVKFLSNTNLQNQERMFLPLLCARDVLGCFQCTEFLTF